MLSDYFNNFLVFTVDSLYDKNNSNLDNTKDFTP